MCNNSDVIIIIQGINLTWEGYRLEQFVHKFSECIFNFQEKVETWSHSCTRFHSHV